MNDLRYIFAEPIEIEGIGSLHSLNIIEFSRYANYFDILTITQITLLQQVDMKDTERRKYIEENITNFDVIASEINLLNALVNLFKICFKTEDIKIGVEEDSSIYISVNGNKIDRNNYDYIRNQIIKINNLHFPKQSSNPELQKWFDRARKAKNRGSSGDKMDMEDIVTTIVAITGIPYREIKKMTVYQINKTIERINKVKEFEMNVQFVCVGAKDVKLDSYLMHIDEEMDEKLSVGLNEVQQKMGNLGIG